MTDTTEPSAEAVPTKRVVWDAIWTWLKAEGYERKLDAFVKVNDALDRFRAAGVREERERLRKIIFELRETRTEHRVERGSLSWANALNAVQRELPPHDQ